MNINRSTLEQINSIHANIEVYECQAKHTCTSLSDYYKFVTVYNNTFIVYIALPKTVIQCEIFESIQGPNAWWQSRQLKQSRTILHKNKILK